VESSPQREENGLVLRRFRQREMIRVAYRDLAGLADPLEVSRELSELAEACVRVAADLTHSRSEGREGHNHDLLWILGLGKFGSRQMHYGSDLDLILLYDAPPAAESAEMRANAQLSYDNRGEEILRVLSAVTSEGVAYSVDLRLRPEGSSGLLARSWESFLAYSRGYMQPWERMALVRSRMLEKPGLGAGRWDDVVEQVVWRYPWEEEAFEQIRRLKRRIETEKSKESAVCVDFKYGKGGITDLEFLIQFLQIAYGNRHPGVRAPGLAQAACALKETGALSARERDEVLAAHQFQRRTENHYQLLQEWTSREVSRESPLLARLARSLGYCGELDAARKAFLADWDAHARIVRQMVEKYFY